VAVSARRLTLARACTAALLALTLHAEDFASLRRALTATRLLLPLGTRLSLKAYISVLRCWVASLRPGDVQVALDEYQTAIEAVRVKDDRLRRFAFAEPAFGPVAGMLRHLALAAGLGLVALPGLAAWTPVWAVIRMRERALLSRGPGWNDSIAVRRHSASQPASQSGTRAGGQEDSPGGADAGNESAAVLAGHVGGEPGAAAAPQAPGSIVGLVRPHHPRVRRGGGLAEVLLFPSQALPALPGVHPGARPARLRG
jgi:hypothetical protein